MSRSGLRTAEVTSATTVSFFFASPGETACSVTVFVTPTAIPRRGVTSTRNVADSPMPSSGCQAPVATASVTSFCAPPVVSV
ncbi:MAG: hypothetical protein BWY76_00651 [bacterium ADurb.Bin429]|nr:MAG: hypothetical protein BWY76_00651 [bacterium ADurb.Bin429]